MVTAACWCVAVLAITSCVASHRLVREFAVAGSLLIVMLVHTEFNSTVSAFAVVGLVLVNVVACIRVGEVALPNRWLVAALCWFYGVTALHQHGSSHLAATFLTLAATLCFAGHVTALGRRAIRPLTWVVATVLIVNGVSAIRERFFGSNAIWPRRDGVTLKLNGINTLWEGAGGRAMGTLGWAITLGVVCAAFVVIAVWLTWTRRSLFWAVVCGLGSFTILLSGTRTALLMLALAVILALLYATRRLVLLVPIAAIGALIVAASAVNVRSIFGFGEAATDTSSVEHRTAVWKAVPHLLTDRPFSDVIVGNGYPHANALLHNGAIPHAGTVPVFDNEVARSLIGIGLLGLFLFAAACIKTARQSGKLGFILACAIVLGSLSYDILTWSSITLLLVFVLSLRTTTHPESIRDKNHAAERSTGPHAISNGSEHVAEPPRSGGKALPSPFVSRRATLGGKAHDADSF